MALTPSTMIPLGTRAPEFSLPDTDEDQSVGRGPIEPQVPGMGCNIKWKS